MKQCSPVRCKSGNKTTETGYFLLNILIGMAVISLIASLSIPYIRNFQPHLDLHSAKKQIASDLRYVQQLSVTEQSIYGVEFDETREEYEIIKISENASSTVKRQTLPQQVNIVDVASSSDGIVEFNFYGGVDEACKVLLENSEGESGEVRIKPSGYIDI